VNLKQVLRTVKTILVIDWPSKDVPEALTLAGFHVIVRGGPRPEDYSVYELKNREIVVRQLGRPPENAELIYSYRSFSELSEIVSTAKRLGGKTIWTQSGLSALGVRDAKGCWVPEAELQSARQLVRSAGLELITQPYIGDVARELDMPNA
jgi:predicted CoA-binding protein